MNASLTGPAIASRILKFGAESMIMSARQLDAFIAADTARCAKAIKFSGAKMD